MAKSVYEEKVKNLSWDLDVVEAQSYLKVLYKSLSQCAKLFYILEEIKKSYQGFGPEVALPLYSLYLKVQKIKPQNDDIYKFLKVDYEITFLHYSDIIKSISSKLFTSNPNIDTAFFWSMADLEELNEQTYNKNKNTHLIHEEGRIESELKEKIITDMHEYSHKKTKGVRL